MSFFRTEIGSLSKAVQLWNLQFFSSAKCGCYAHSQKVCPEAHPGLSGHKAQVAQYMRSQGQRTELKGRKNGETLQIGNQKLGSCKTSVFQLVMSVSKTRKQKDPLETGAGDGDPAWLELEVTHLPATGKTQSFVCHGQEARGK